MPSFIKSNNIFCLSPSHRSFSRANISNIKINSFSENSNIESLNNSNSSRIIHPLKFNRLKKLKEINKKNFDTIPNINMDEIMSIDNYNAILTESMANYRTESVSLALETEEEKKIKEKKDNKGNKENKDDKDDIISELDKSIEKSETKIIVDENLLDSSTIRVGIKLKDYISPLDSLDIINTNRFIYDNINSSLVHIQKLFYNKAIKSIENYEKTNKKMLKIKVSSLGVGPKNKESGGLKKFSSIIAETVNEEIEKEDNEEVYDEITQNYLDKKKEKEKEKEKLKQKKSKNKKNDLLAKIRITKLDDWELYGTYKYSLKNFPEGREQFSLRYNSIDAVLFGGMVSNKNNYLWTLDPSK